MKHGKESKLNFKRVTSCIKLTFRDGYHTEKEGLMCKNRNDLFNGDQNLD